MNIIISEIKTEDLLSEVKVSTANGVIGGRSQASIQYTGIVTGTDPWQNISANANISPNSNAVNFTWEGGEG